MSTLRLRVSPEAARDAVVGLLADALAVSPRDVAIVSGHASPDKTVALNGLDTDEIERRLGGAVGKDTE